MEENIGTGGRGFQVFMRENQIEPCSKRCFSFSHGALSINHMGISLLNDGGLMTVGDYTNQYVGIWGDPIGKKTYSPTSRMKRHRVLNTAQRIRFTDKESKIGTDMI